MQASADSPFVLSDAVLNAQRRRVFSIKVDGARFFVKTDRVRKCHMGHRVQSLLYRASRNPLIAPTIFPDIASSMAYEVSKLARLRNKKFPVPEVVFRALAISSPVMWVSPTRSSVKIRRMRTTTHRRP